LNVTCSVPQGSVLVLLRFLINAHDIVKASNFDTALYSGDINLHISGKDDRVLEKLVNAMSSKIDHLGTYHQIMYQLFQKQFRAHEPAWVKFGG